VDDDESQSTAKPCSPDLKAQQNCRRQEKHEGCNTFSVVALHNCSVLLGLILLVSKKSHTAGDSLLSYGTLGSDFDLNPTFEHRFLSPKLLLSLTVLMVMPYGFQGCDPVLL